MFFDGGGDGRDLIHGLRSPTRGVFHVAGGVVVCKETCFGNRIVTRIASVNFSAISSIVSTLTGRLPGSVPMKYGMRFQLAGYSSRGRTMCIEDGNGKFWVKRVRKGVDPLVSRPCRFAR